MRGDGGLSDLRPSGAGGNDRSLLDHDADGRALELWRQKTSCFRGEIRAAVFGSPMQQAHGVCIIRIQCHRTSRRLSRNRPLRNP